MNMKNHKILAAKEGLENHNKTNIKF